MTIDAGPRPSPLDIRCEEHGQGPGRECPEDPGFCWDRIKAWESQLGYMDMSDLYHEMYDILADIGQNGSDAVDDHLWERIVVAVYRYEDGHRLQDGETEVPLP